MQQYRYVTMGRAISPHHYLVELITGIRVPSVFWRSVKEIDITEAS